MAIGIRVDPELGLYQVNDSSGFVIKNPINSEGFLPYKINSVKRITTSTSLSIGDAGLIILDNPSSPITVTLPNANLCPGALFIVRNNNNQNHIIRIEETGGQIVSPYTINVSSITLKNKVNSSAVLLSDGVNYHLLSWNEEIT